MTLACLQEAAAETAKIEPMNAAGWIFMIGSVGFVTILTFWCFYRVLTAGKEPPQPIQDFHSA